MSLSALHDIHAELSRDNAKKRGARDTVLRMADLAEKKVKDMNARQQSISDGIILVQRFAEGIQSGVVQKFEDLLTRGVRQIFQKDYTVSIEFATSGNTLNADFFMTLPDGKKVNLAKGEGGGMRDLVAVLQRILYIILEPSHPAKVIFFDENLKAMDSGRSPAAFTFIKELCVQLQIQVVFITHSQAALELEGEGMKVIGIGG
jgi:hypothetical protein